MPSSSTVADPALDPRVSRRRGRYAAQRIVWAHTKIKPVALCGRAVSDSEQGVAVKVTGTPGSGDARAGFSGLQSCSSVWACPVCSEKINAGRQAELDAGIRSWLAAGHAVLFGTLTMRHHKGHRLASLLDAIGPAWNRTTSGAGVAWNGGKSERGDKARFGIAGYARVVETKHGEANGWHPHIHFLLFLDKPLTVRETLDLEARMFGRWEAALARRGFSTLRDVGIDLRPVTDAAGMGDYFTKSRWSADASGAAYEVTGSQSKRLGKGESRTPFQILRGVAVEDQHARDLALWHEWEQASRGRRQLTWSRGMRKLLTPDPELTDEELVDEDLGGEVVAVFTRHEWKSWAPDRCLLLEAAEAGNLDWFVLAPPRERAARRFPAPG